MVVSAIWASKLLDLHCPRFKYCLHSLKNLWKAFHKTFRILKTDLDLRPIFHKTDDAMMAHLNLGLLAYWLVSTIRYQLKLQGIHHDWSEIVRIMNTQKSVTTIVENKKGNIIQIRQCSEQTGQVKQIQTIFPV